MNVFKGKSFGVGNERKPGAQLHKVEYKSFEHFYEENIKICKKGTKIDDYITIASDVAITPGDPNAKTIYEKQDHYHRYNDTQLKAGLLPYDGDKSKNDPHSCIDPELVHNALLKLNINHIIYTSHSHNPPKKIRWRLLIPCEMEHQGQLEPTVNALTQLLRMNGCDDLVEVNEIKTWSQPWFLPTRDNPNDFKYKRYCYFDGNDFIAEDEVPESEQFEFDPNAKKDNDYRVDLLVNGDGDTGFNESIGVITRRLVEGDPNMIRSVLRGLMVDNTDRQKEALLGYDKGVSEIDRQINGAVKKYSNVDFNDWGLSPVEDDDRLYTKYPDQGGIMEEFIQYCMDWMMFPNRQIAVICCHSIVSVLGGRVYSLESGSGVCFSVLCMGRSTIGKDNFTKFFMHVIHQLKDNIHEDPNFMGSTYHTSPKNYVDEMKKTGSVIFIRTESGHSDNSTAGDMSRFKMYELSLATKHGKLGIMPSGGQNDKISELYSPAVTTIRESVEEIQTEADLKNKSDVSGLSGRRSHTMIDPHKVKNTKFTHKERANMKLPKGLKVKLKKLYDYANNPRRFDVTKPMDESLWKTVKYENYSLIEQIELHWLDKENEYSYGKSKNSFLSTFWGRMHEKVPSWAARLSILENPDFPLISDKHIKVTAQSLEAEAFTYSKREDKTDPWGMIVDQIKDIFSGDMTRHDSLISKGKKHLEKRDTELLRDGVAKFGLLKNLLKNNDGYKLLKSTPNFDRILQQKLEFEGIFTTTRKEGKDKFQVAGILTYRS